MDKSEWVFCLTHSVVMTIIATEQYGEAGLSRQPMSSGCVS